MVDLGANGHRVRRDSTPSSPRRCDRRVVLVGVDVPAPLEDDNNDVLRAAASRHAPQVRFVDWAAIVDGHPGALGPDEVHPTPPSRVLLADAVLDALDR